MNYIKCTTHKPVSPGAPGSFYLPAVYIDLNKEGLFLTKSEIIQKLWEGNPRIVVDESPIGIIIRMMMLESGQEKMVAEKLLEIFKK